MEAFMGLAIEIGKCIAGPIKLQFDYLCCFNNNIQILRGEAQKLKEANDGLQMRVDEDKNDARVILPEVEIWLENASQKNDIINEIENEIPLVEKRCLNLISRYSLSRKAKKIAEDLKELHNNRKFDKISLDARPASMESLPLGPKEKFETRKKIEEDVMETLRDRNVNMIGLCGMGGVGKTTMAERIMDRVKEEKLFDETLKVVVSQQVDMPKLQQSIANQLNLTLHAEDLATRAYKIRTRLTNAKGILIVVDDVWEYLQLKDLGIPCGNTFGGSCIVLLTSRNRIALNMMETQRIFEIEILPESEAWLLFREKTNNCVDKEDLHSVAEEIAKECKGLPVALVTVGRALRNKTNRQLWEDALVQLRSNTVVLPNMEKNVYGALKLSYDNLENEQARSLFLLCSMFEEDYDIRHEMLTWCGIGLDMFKELGNLNEARNRTRTLIEELKDRSLLLDGFDEHYVKMHDVVRDTAIYIASKEKCGGSVINLGWPTSENCYEDCFWIKLTNLSNRTEFLVELNCPSLRVLTINNVHKKNDKEIRLPDSFFNGMQKVRVLIVEKNWIRSLTPIALLQDNLKILCLFHCSALQSISVVGELSKLELLCCRGCRGITVLPTEIGRLNRLRLLEIINCIHLKRIAPGVISKLINLEELRMIYSFTGWEAKECNTKENAALVELESLTKLTCLKIQIVDLSLVAEEICLPSKIVKYDIQIMKEPSWANRDHLSKCMSLEILGQMNVGDWIKTLIRRTELLHLKGDGADQVNLVEVEKLKRLYFERCSSVKKLINTTSITTKTSLFPSLESLYLERLDNLEEIIAVGYNYSDHYSCFGNIKRIRIEECPRLRCLFPMSVAIRSFPQLEVLQVIDCKAMEDIFYDDDKMEKDGKIISHNLHMAFPNLNTLYLMKLPRLKAQETLDK